MPQASRRSLFDSKIVRRALIDALTKLNPRAMMKNPVMFVVEIGSALTTVLLIANMATHKGDLRFDLQITLWLWFTVLFANFAEAMAEGRGKAQADALRQAKSDTTAYRVENDIVTEVPSSQLRAGDVCRCIAGQMIPGDGEVILGVASVDESAITGESAPVIREAGGDRSAVTGGTRVLSDVITVRITSNPGETFLDRMIALVEGAERQKTPNEIALNILLAGLTIIFLLAVVTLQPFAIYSGAPQTIFVLISLLVCLIPTTIGGLLSAIGIAGMDRLVQHNVLATSGRAVEAAGDVNTLLLDKTGTITIGNRQASEFVPAPGVSPEQLADAAQLSSLSDETPEGRSIVVLAKEQFNLRGRELGQLNAEFVPFSATTRMSGIEVDGRSIRKGAADAIAGYLQEHGSSLPADVRESVDKIARSGGTPLVVAENGRALGVIHLKDVVKGGMRERFEQLRAMGIRTVMITGDNPLTAAAIAREAGVDDFLAEAKPKDKMDLIKREQADGKLVAMTGDGTNDAPRARTGRRRCCHELRHPGGERGRQHGRPRLQPDQAHRDRRYRQTTAHDARRTHYLLHLERRGQVLRHHPGDVCGCLPGAQQPEHHAPAQRRVGRVVRRHLQCADHHRAHPAGLARRPLSTLVGGRAAAPQPARLWLRRNHSAVPRHQADRPRRHRAAPRIRIHHEEPDPHRHSLHPHHRHPARSHLSPADHRSRAGSVPQ